MTVAMPNVIADRPMPAAIVAALAIRETFMTCIPLFLTAPIGSFFGGAVAHRRYTRADTANTRFCVELHLSCGEKSFARQRRVVPSRPGDDQTRPVWVTYTVVGTTVARRRTRHFRLRRARKASTSWLECPAPGRVGRPGIPAPTPMARR
jgi:hypothetical protein